MEMAIFARRAKFRILRRPSLRFFRNGRRVAFYVIRRRMTPHFSLAPPPNKSHGRNWRRFGRFCITSLSMYLGIFRGGGGGSFLYDDDFPRKVLKEKTSGREIFSVWKAGFVKFQKSSPYRMMRQLRGSSKTMGAKNATQKFFPREILLETAILSPYG